MLYQIYNNSPSARACISDTTRPLMLYILHNNYTMSSSHIRLSTCSYPPRANVGVVLCCQLPDFILIQFSKTLSHFVVFFITNRIWSDSLLVHEPIKLHNSSYIVSVYIYIYIYIYINIYCLNIDSVIFWLEDADVDEYEVNMSIEWRNVFISKYNLSKRGFKMLGLPSLIQHFSMMIISIIPTRATGTFHFPFYDM